MERVKEEIAIVCDAVRGTRRPPPPPNLVNLSVEKGAKVAVVAARALFDAVRARHSAVEAVENVMGQRDAACGVGVT